MIFQPELETMPRADLVRLQRERLRKRFDVDLDGLAEQPFRVKSDLRDAYPFGLLRVPREDCVRVHASSGTRGKATIVAYTRDDLALWADCCARAVAAAGGGPGTLVHVAYGYGLFTGGLGFHYGAERLGCTVVPASSGNTPRQAQLLEDLGAEILCCTPSYALAIADHIEDVTRLGLRAGLFGAEPWTERLRGAVEDALNLRALDVYGLSEIIGPGVASECLEGPGGAHVNEDHFLVETIDPDTGQAVSEGETGELVFTTLTKEAMPLLRYRTGDLASVTREPCPCGRTFARMSRVVGRTDDMLIIRGVNVFPSEIERVLLSVEGIAPHYQLVVDRRERLDELTVQVEGRVDEAPVRERLERALGLSAHVEVVAPGTIPRSEGKALRVLDRRA
ncbi:MAG: phenylacetate--CoA ligase [Acidobacteriota bacterium]|nr:phenylacetate--CoA ligase [Acidobacteriota bacterium]MDE3189830.1 phenylacetate--CoA ligase [Acidobacteriota bacterium]